MFDVADVRGDRDEDRQLTVIIATTVCVFVAATAAVISVVVVTKRRARRRYAQCVQKIKKTNFLFSHNS